MNSQKITLRFRRLLKVTFDSERSPDGHSKKEKAPTKYLQVLDFQLWTSLGLNQGPPDYESVALTN